MPRKVERYPVTGPNSLWQVYKTVSPWRAMRNFVFIQVSRYSPSLRLKNWIFRHVLGMRVGENTAFALMAMPDVFFPERITVGDDSIIGYNTTILCHEYLTREYRLGDVRIGSRVMIGAGSIILPGVTIGDDAMVGAGSVVVRDVAPGSFVAGNPLQVIRPGWEGQAGERSEWAGKVGESSGGTTDEPTDRSTTVAAGGRIDEET
ncbi:acyltransferase [Gorillibacterium timonense]|uniref:acyltransferase n=1 Tax=Gorillibacterium timonense TaxID=1689269 RepID=UPI000A9C66EF|nr:acyltransferase [Gorillibacterium timonense]